MTRDLMFRDEIEEIVASSYSELTMPGGPALGFYADDQLEGVPDGARDWALGLGNPLTHAELKPGETVLDLGSGSGIDVIIAARQVGSEGRAIGIDMLPEMIQRSRANAEAADVPNAEFVQGHMDDIPIPDDTVDVVISNGSINLAARKSRVFAEARRVLKPGGRLCVADLTIEEKDLPTEVLTHPSAWAGWVSGALAERVFVHKLKRVGFENVAVRERNPFALEQAAEYPLFTDEVIQLMRDLIPTERQDQIAVSVIFTAEAP